VSEYLRCITTHFYFLYIIIFVYLIPLRVNNTKGNFHCALEFVRMPAGWNWRWRRNCKLGRNDFASVSKYQIWCWIDLPAYPYKSRENETNNAEWDVLLRCGIRTSIERWKSAIGQKQSVAQRTNLLFL